MTHVGTAFAGDSPENRIVVTQRCFAQRGSVISIINHNIPQVKTVRSRNGSESVRQFDLSGGRGKPKVGDSPRSLDEEDTHAARPALQCGAA